MTRGWVADFLTKLALPVLVFPPRELFRVFVHGRGFELPIEESNPAVGFHVTCFVRAKTAADAAARANELVKGRWETFYPEAQGQLVVSAEEVELVGGRFARRSRTGFVFYSGNEEKTTNFPI